MSRDLNRRLAILKAASRAPASNSGCSAKAELVDRLERMVVDVRAQPEWREPTLAQSATSLAAIKAYLTERFGCCEPPPEDEGTRGRNRSPGPSEGGSIRLGLDGVREAVVVAASGRRIGMKSALCAAQRRIRRIGLSRGAPAVTLGIEWLGRRRGCGVSSRRRDHARAGAP
jgi:hypothetical protein